MNANDSLAVELRFLPASNARTWDNVLEALITWVPALRPATVLRLADPEQREQPWSPLLRSAICQACAASVKNGWLLAAESGPVGAITIDIRSKELRCSLALPRLDKSPIDAMLGLLALLHPIHRPAVAMAFDLNNRVDSELVMQGLDGLSQLPPLLFFDESSATAVGGAAYIRTAPCPVRSAPDGLILELHPNFWEPQTENDRIRISAVERHFGISPGTPLVLLDT
jgi:hypothetical protein